MCLYRLSSNLCSGCCHRPHRPCCCRCFSDGFNAPKKLPEKQTLVVVVLVLVLVAVVLVLVVVVLLVIVVVTHLS